MENNIKLLGVQFLTIIIVGSILELFLDLPEWTSIIIASIFFWTFYMIIQINMSVKNICEHVSKDGIAGARLFGIFITSIIVPFMLGIYEYIIIDIIYLAIGVIGIVVSRSFFWDFLFENNWKKMYWFVYFGCVLILSGVYSLFAAKDIAPCIVLPIKYRVIAFFVLGITFLASIPPSSVISKFATINYERYGSD